MGRTTDIFSNPDYLGVMYYLAKYNPSIAAIKIAKKIKLSPEKVEKILNELEKMHVVTEKNKEYTLTDSGLLGLYNFHVNFNEHDLELTLRK